jgi:hypothetical protein
MPLLSKEHDVRDAGYIQGPMPPITCTRNRFCCVAWAAIEWLILCVQQELQVQPAGIVSASSAELPKKPAAEARPTTITQFKCCDAAE